MWPTPALISYVFIILWNLILPGLNLKGTLVTILKVNLSSHFFRIRYYNVLSDSKSVYHLSIKIPENQFPAWEEDSPPTDFLKSFATTTRRFIKVKMYKLGTMHHWVRIHAEMVNVNGNMQFWSKMFICYELGWSKAGLAALFVQTQN